VSILSGRAVLVPGTNIDTDVLYPGIYLNIDDPELMKPYLFEGLDPSLRNQLSGDTVLVVGENFGMGSSREHVPLAMKASGIRCVVGSSFARIFHRNCINLALPVIACPEAVQAARAGSEISVDAAAGRVAVDGQEFGAAPVPPFMLEMLEQGGLIPWARHKLSHSQP
jgi:3-isopropylmalate/(R)-2-methylmalate dehydratase small subunit